ncbi:hypothetical protein [Bacillus sp. FJAT-29937]|uniref:hypothetical protein n=1 Tax=Bacillus sp. FJAT-29937 TaxID=1720553 RepID=UPI00082E2D2B|nr:hypothetical protein [Bacillus sp. FJAT-29937]
MNNINPLFAELNQYTPEKIKVQRPVKVRAERRDKQHNVKFPVDHLFHMKLRTLCKQLEPLYKQKYQKPLSQTKFNTLLLRYVLNHKEMVDWDLEYVDSKRYMHTNLLKLEYREIGGSYGIAIRKGYSDRKTVYLMMRAGLAWVERGGDIEKII